MRTHLQRGTVTIAIRYRDPEISAAVLDEGLISAYFARLEKVRKSHNLPGEVTLEMLMNLPGVLTEEERTVDEEKFKQVGEVLQQALERMTDHRSAEGRRLKGEFLPAIIGEYK